MQFPKSQFCTKSCSALVVGLEGENPGIWKCILRLQWKPVYRCETSVSCPWNSWPCLCLLQKWSHFRRRKQEMFLSFAKSYFLSWFLYFCDQVWRRPLPKPFQRLLVERLHHFGTCLLKLVLSVLCLTPWFSETSRCVGIGDPLLCQYFATLEASNTYCCGGTCGH